jgi:hypothetical protein
MTNSLDAKYLDVKIIARVSLVVKMLDVEIIEPWHIRIG